MTRLYVLNDSEQKKTVAALNRAAAKATGKARATIEALAKSLDHPNPTTPGTGRAKPRKGKTTMAKHKKARATKRTGHKHKSNPTTPKATRRKVYRRRSNPTGLAALKGFKIMDVLTEGASIVGGELAQSFGQRQVEKFMPSLAGLPSALISGAAIAGAGIYFGKGNKIAKGLAIGAVAGTLRGLAKSFAPSLFAGADDEMGATAAPAGYMDPTTGEWVAFAGPDEIAGAEYMEGAEEMAGVLYDESREAYPNVRF